MWKIVPIALLLVLFSCKKREEAIRWDMNMKAPLAHGELTISDLLPDSILQVENDNSITLNFDYNLYRLDLDSIAKIPDTVIYDTFALPVPFPVSIDPGQVFINDPQETIIEAGNAALKYIKIKRGWVSYNLYSSIQGDVLYEYILPTAKDANGNIFQKNVFVPAASGSTKSVVSGTFNLAGYAIDLTGLNGNQVNTLPSTINVAVDPGNPGSVNVSNADTIVVHNNLSEVSVEYAKGYFGSLNFSYQDANVIDAFEIIKNGTFNLNNVSIDFELINGAGIDGKLVVNKINSINDINGSQTLSHEIIGQNININRAYETGSEIVPYQYFANFNDNNSNIKSLIEQQPDSIGVDINLEFNPLGNVSGYNDFISSTSPIELNLGVDIPLSMMANNLVLTDTVHLDIEEAINVESGNLYLTIENGFPLEASVDLLVIDQNNMIVDHIFSPETIPSGELSSNQVSSYSVTEHTIELGALNVQRILKSKKLLVKFTFNTPGDVPLNIYDYNSIRFDIKSDFLLQVKVP